MEKRAGENIEEFIRNNRHLFEGEVPDERHDQKFLFRLNQRIKKIISIVPYLLRVAIATVIIFTISIVIWDNYIRKDRHEITLTHKIELAGRKISNLFIKH